MSDSSYYSDGEWIGRGYEPCMCDHSIEEHMHTATSSPSRCEAPGCSCIHYEAVDA